MDSATSGAGKEQAAVRVPVGWFEGGKGHRDAEVGLGWGGDVRPRLARSARDAECDKPRTAESRLKDVGGAGA